MFSDVVAKVRSGQGEANLKLPSAPQTNQLVTEQKWDWKTATTDPEGNPLPEGALGWRPDGSPDFGTGVEAWQKKTKWKLGEAWQSGWKEGQRIADEAGYEGDTMQRLVSAVNLTKAGFSSILAEPLFAALQLPATLTKQLGGSVGLALQDMVYNKKDLTEIDWKGNWEASRLAYSIALRPFIMRSGDEGMKLRDKFVERMNNGERPDLIAEDMLQSGEANTWIELGGELMFDPLNAVGKAGKIKQATKFAKVAKADMAVMEVAEVGDKISDALKLENKAEILQRLPDIRNTVLEAQDAAAASMNALSKPGAVAKDVVIKRMHDLIKYTPDSRNQVIMNRASVMLETWMSSLGNNNAKMTDLLEAVVDLRGADEGKSIAALEKLLNSGVSPNLLFSPAGNDLMVIAEKMMAEHGDNLLKIFGKEASLTKKIKSAKDFIATAEKQGKLFNVADTAKLADTKKELEALQEAKKAISFEDNAARMLEAMKNTTDDMFPSAKKLLEAEKTAADLTKAGQAVPPKTQALADMAKQMRPYERKVAEIHNMLQDEKKGVVKILNRMYSKIYLGMSPGYAFRNMTQNRFQMWLDYGGSMLRGSGDEAMDIASRLHGAPLTAGESFGKFDPRGVLKEVQKTDFWSGVKRYMNGEGDWKRIGDSRILAQNDEAWASKKVFGTMYKKTFTEALDPLVKSIMKDKRFANLAPEVASSLKGELVNNFGDVDAALASLSKKMSLGYERPFTRLDKLPQQLQKYLESVGAEQRFVTEVLNANSSDEAIEAANRIFDDIAGQGLPQYTEGIKADLSDPIQRALNVGMKDGDIGFGTVRAKAARIRASDQAIDAASVIVQEANKKSGALASVQDKYLAPLKGWTSRRNEVRDTMDAAVEIIQQGKRGNFTEAWTDLRRMLDLPADTVAPTTMDEFVDSAWKAAIGHSESVYGQDLLESLDRVGEFLKETGQTDSIAQLDEVRKTFEAYTNVTIAEGGVLLSEAPLTGTRSTVLRTLANKYGIASVSDTGASLDKVLVNILNKHAGLDVPFKTLDDPISLEMANKAFAKYTKQPIIEAVAKAEDVAVEGEKVAEVVNRAGGIDIPKNALKVPNKEPSFAALINMNNPQAAKDALEYIDTDFGKITQLLGETDSKTIAELSSTLKQRIGEIRAVSARAAAAHRDFTLLNYAEQTYSGVVASYVFPFYKWYAGTYSNYVSRVMSNPAILGNYGRIKDAFAQVHSDLPDWWKYNLSSNDMPEPVQNAIAGVQKFFGMEQQPLFVNLEALLWPLQGLTGIDFNDKEKVVNWWTYGLDQLGKAGPTVWTPITMATGLKLIADGNQEAGERWVSRLSSQTSTIKSVTASLAQTEVGQAVGLPKTGIELDPIVNIFMGGIDPYERKRVRRAIGDMMANNADPEFRAQAIDAAYNQEGDIWDEAVGIANSDRTLGNVMSTMFGVGLKARTESDMQIDMFYSEYGRIMQMRTTMAPEAFREQMALLGEKYPFMDAVLIGSKTDDTRDAAFAYNVLSRIPPGDMSRLLEFVGVRQDTVDYFFEKKGDLSEMSKDDRLRFNAAMLSISAIYQIPDKATKMEWSEAKFQYAEAQTRSGLTNKDGTETVLGEKLQTYYSLMDEDLRKADAFLDSNPDLRRAMDMKNAFIANNPILNAYYGGIDTIERYYQAQVRSEMVKKYGDDIYQKYDFYNNLLDTKSKNAYLKANSDLKAFKEEKGKWQNYVDEQTAKLYARMPEGKAPGFRHAQTQTQRSLQEMTLQGQRPVTAQELWSQMQPELVQIVQLSLQSGQEISYPVMQQLDYLGGYYGINSNEVLQILMAGQ